MFVGVGCYMQDEFQDPPRVGLFLPLAEPAHDSKDVKSDTANLRPPCLLNLEDLTVYKIDYSAVGEKTENAWK